MAFRSKPVWCVFTHTTKNTYNCVCSCWSENTHAGGAGYSISFAMPQRDNQVAEDPFLYSHMHVPLLPPYYHWFSLFLGHIFQESWHQTHFPLMWGTHFQQDPFKRSLKPPGGNVTFGTVIVMDTCCSQMHMWLEVVGMMVTSSVLILYHYLIFLQCFLKHDYCIIYGKMCLSSPNVIE